MRATEQQSYTTQQSYRATEHRADTKVTEIISYLFSGPNEAHCESLKLEDHLCKVENEAEPERLRCFNLADQRHDIMRARRAVTRRCVLQFCTTLSTENLVCEEKQMFRKATNFSPKSDM